MLAKSNKYSSRNKAPCLLSLIHKSYLNRINVPADALYRNLSANCIDSSVDIEKLEVAQNRFILQKVKLF